MGLKEKTLKGFMWSAIQSGGTRIISFVVFLILARLIGPESFGLIALAAVFTAFVSVFVEQSFAEVIVQRHELKSEHLDAAFWLSICAAIVLTLLAVLGATYAADFYDQPRLELVLQVLSVSIIFAALSGVQQAILRRNFRFKSLAVRSLLAALISGIVGVAMAWQGYGVWSLVGQQLAFSFVGMLVLWVASSWRPRLSFSFICAKDMLGFVSNMIGFRLVAFFNQKIPDLFIGYFLGAISLGYYTIGRRLIDIIMQLVTNTVGQVMLPTFSKLQKNPEQFRKAFYKTTQLVSMVSFPVFVSMVILANELVPFLFGDKWQQSVPIVQVLAFLGINGCVMYFTGTVMVAMGKPGLLLIISLLDVVIKLVIFVMLAKSGIVEILTAMVIGIYAMIPVKLAFVHHVIRIDWRTYIAQIFPAILGSLALVGVLILMKSIFPVKEGMFLITCAVAGILSYMLTIFLVARQLFNELIDLVRTLFFGKLASKGNSV